MARPLGPSSDCCRQHSLSLSLCCHAKVITIEYSPTDAHKLDGASLRMLIPSGREVATLEKPFPRAAADPLQALTMPATRWAWPAVPTGPPWSFQRSKLENPQTKSTTEGRCWTSPHRTTTSGPASSSAAWLSPSTQYTQYPYPFRGI